MFCHSAVYYANEMVSNQQACEAEATEKLFPSLLFINWDFFGEN